MAVDPGHPFPVLISKNLTFAVLLERKGQDHLAIIPIPKNIPRIFRVPSSKNDFSFILVEDIIKEYLRLFFRGYKIKNCSLILLSKKLKCLKVHSPSKIELGQQGHRCSKKLLLQIPFPSQYF